MDEKSDEYAIKKEKIHLKYVIIKIKKYFLNVIETWKDG